MATIWSPTTTVKLGSFSIEASANIGSIGVQAKYDDKSGVQIGASYGIGGSIALKWGD